MGNCTFLQPVEPGLEEEPYKVFLAKTFGSCWDQLLMGADKPFTYHCFWDILLEINGVTWGDQGPLLPLLSKTDFVYYNIIVG